MIIALAVAPQAQALDGKWNADAGDNWGASGRWTNSQVAGGAGFIASFDFNITANRTVTNNAARTIGRLRFADSGTASHTWTLGGSSVLTLDNSGSTPTIESASRTNFISAPLAGTQGLLKIGGSPLVLSGANTYSGVTTVTNNELRLQNAAALGNSTQVIVKHSATSGGNGTMLGLNAYTAPSSVTITLLSTNISATSYRSAIVTRGGASTINGNIIVTGNDLCQIYADSGHTLNLNGNITGDNFTGTLFLRGTSGGTININSPSINLGTATFNRTDATTVYLNTSGHVWGTSSIATGPLVLGTHDALCVTAPLVMGQSGTCTPTLDLAGFNQRVTALSLNGNTASPDTCIITNRSANDSRLTIQGTGTYTFGGRIRDALGKIGLTISGLALTLTNANEFNGDTLITEGALYINGPKSGNGSYALGTSGILGIHTLVSGSGSITNADLSTLVVTVPSAGTFLATPNLVMGNGGDLTNNFNLGSGNPTVPVIMATNLAVNGTVYMNITGVGLSVGQFPLIQYETATGIGDNTFVAASLPSGVIGYASNNAANSSIDLVVTQAPYIVWTGATNDGSGLMLQSEWDINTTSNWFDPFALLPAFFSDGLSVVFDDNAEGTNVVVLSTNVSPSGVTVINTNKDYSIEGAFSIIGAGRLTKDGPGLLTIGTSNTYSGDTLINAGTLRLATNNVIPTGTGKGNLAVNGILELNGFSAGVNGLNGTGLITNSGVNPVTLTAGNNNASGSFSGAIRENAGAPLSLVKAGTGTLTLSGPVEYTGDTTVSGTLTTPSLGVNPASSLTLGGTLRLTSDSTNTGLVTLTTSLPTVEVDPGVVVQLGGSISGPTNIIKMGAGTLEFSSNAVQISGGGLQVRQGTLVMNGSAFTNSGAVQDRVGNAAGDNATLVLTNNSQIVKSQNQWFQIGLNGATGVVRMVDGLIQNVGGITIGNGGVGALYQFGGDIYSGGEFDVSYQNAGGQGYYQLSGGTLTNATWIQAARGGGIGIIYQDGGIMVVTNANGFVVGNNAGGSSTGVLYFANGYAGANRMGVGWNGGSRGEATIAGNATVSIGSIGVLLNQAGGTNFSVLNLNGGTLQAPKIYKNAAGTGSTNIVNFNGGLWQVTAAGTVMGTGAGGVGAVDSAFVHAGGAMIDDGGNAITIAQPLLAPFGSGVTSLSLGVASLGGYIGAPYVSISEGGGYGATAVALFDPHSGSVTGLVVTCPGVGYTSIPTVTLTGGGAPDYLGATATIGANTSGGLTKSGTGTLILSGANTYTGPTVVNAGQLRMNSSSTGGGSVTVADNASLGIDLLQAGATLQIGDLTIGDGASLNFNLLAAGNPTQPVLRTANFNFLGGGVLPFNVAGGGLAAGRFTLLEYTGEVAGSAGFDTGTMPSGIDAHIEVDEINKRVELVIDAVNPLIWLGATADWDINASFNWTNPVSGQVQVYTENGGVGYPVFFDDLGLNTMINLTVPLSPGGITVTGSVNSYNFGGAGHLTGVGGIVKDGPSTLVLNTSNAFTGPVEIRGGMVVVSNNAGLGTGAGGTIITNGGTLDISGRNLQYEPITVSGSGVGGNGAIINNGAAQQNATRWITLANDTIVAANNRWDIRGTGGAGSFNGELNLNGFTLTKLGAAQMSIVDSTATNAGNIVAQGGILAITRSKVEGPGFIDVGAATLQMENSSTGYLAKPLIFNQGTLRMQGNSFALDSAITNLTGMTVEVGANLTLTLNQGISGGGWLYKANSNGTLRLTQPSTYTGGTTNALGTIFIGHDQAAGSGVIALTGSGVNLASDDTTPHILANDLIVGQNLTIGHLVNTGSLTFQNSVSIANGIRAIRINSDVIWEGPVGDGAISDKRGPGNLVFKGIANFNLDSPFELEEGTVTIDGGSLTNIDAFRIMCTNVNGVARLVITNGGSLVLTKAGANLRPGYSPGGDATATNIVDIAGLVRMAVGGSGGLVSIGANSARSIVNLFAGGVLETRQVNHAANTSEFNFDGGTLKASEGNLGSTFMQGLTLATIRDGGAIIDTAGFDITIGQPLVANGTGGLAKNGAGVLRLTGANSYTGPTVVNEGLLSVASSQSGGGAFTVAANAALRFSAVPGVTLNTPQITLGGDVLEFDLGANVTPAVPLVSAAAWSAPGAITINILGTNILGTNFVAGQAIALADFGTVLPTTTLGTLPTGVSGTLSNDNDNAVLYLVVTGSARALAWGGELNSIWDINNSVNWTNLATGLWDVYLETPAFGDRVLFDDRAANLTVDVATDVKPVEMAVNSTKNYSIGGAGKITGSVTLGKYGSGALELTSANSYTGGTLLGAGRLNVGHGEALGSGALTLNGGVTLGTAGGAQVITNSLSFGSGSGNIFIDTTGGDLNLTGPLALGAGLELQKTGPNTLKFGPGNISVIGSGMGLDVLNGTVVLDGAAFTNENDGVRLQADGADVSMVRITNGGIWSIGTVGGNPNLVLGSTANKTGSNHVHLSSGKIVFGLSGVQLLVANTANTIGTVVQDGGEITWVGSTNVVRGVALGAAAGAQAQYHLNGGVLDTPRVRRVNGTGSFRFNGGVLKANTDLNAATFMQGLTAATVGDGGANIDTAGFDITIAQPLLADGTGGLAKLGAGTLNLTGNSTYTGLTVVSNGTLGGTGSLQSPTLVETGGALNPGNAGIGTLTINNTLTLAGTTVMEINRTNAQNADLVAGVTTLTAGGTLVVTNVGEPLQLWDTFNLFDAATFAGGFAGLVLPDLPTSEWKWKTNNLMVNGTVSVVPTNEPPVAGPDAFAVVAEQPTRLAIAKLMTNDYDPEGGTLTFVGNFTTNKGSVVIDGDHVVYTPTNGFTGLDTFTYTITDALGSEAQGTVSMTVINAPLPGQNQLGAPVFEAGTANLRFAGIPGRDYILLRALAVEGPWGPVVTNTAPANGLIDFTDPAAPSTNAFYKTQEKP